MSVTRRACLQIAALAAGGAASAAPTSSVGGRPAAKAAVDVKVEPAYADAIEALKRYIDLHLEAYGLPGMTLALVGPDGFTALITAGWANADARVPLTSDHYLQIGSVSKSFCSITILRLVDAGKLTLDSEIQTILPEIPLHANSGITVRHLLAHVSGLPADISLYPRGNEALWIGFMPGSHFYYSDTGYQILDKVVLKLTGKPYTDALKELVLTPLGMTEAKPAILNADRGLYATGYNPFFQDRPFPRGGRLTQAAWCDYTIADGSIAATPEQMAAYLRWLIESARPGGARFLSVSSRRAFTTPVIDTEIFGPGGRYALGMAVVPVDGSPCLHHLGHMPGGFTSSLHVDEAVGVGAFSNINATAGAGYHAGDVTIYAVKLLRAAREGKPLPALPEIPSATKIDKAENLAGVFSSVRGETIELVASGDGLVLRHSGDTLSLLYENSNESFLVVGPGDESSRLVLELVGGKVRTVGWKDELFCASGVTPPTLAPDLSNYAGTYRLNCAFVCYSLAKVFARRDGLWLSWPWIKGEVCLVRLADGTFRPGTDESSPERVVFDRPISGRAQRMNYSGWDLLRL